VPDIRIRLAQPADSNQLAPLREALWPESSAEEHAREIAPILNGNASFTMLSIVLVAEASDQTLVGFLEAGLLDAPTMRWGNERSAAERERVALGAVAAQSRAVAMTARRMSPAVHLPAVKRAAKKRTADLRFVAPCI
jgi:hypothetical protein